MLDTPANLGHPALADARITQQYCYAAKKATQDISVHGTAVTSIIGAKKSGTYPDFIGIAPEATIATFGVPEQACGVELLEEALLKIKEFRPDIVNISSNVIRLTDAKIVQILEKIIEENPSVVFVAAAGNDGAVLSPADIPCRELSNLETSTQWELEHLSKLKLKENFVLVGNLARKDDVQFDNLLLLPNDDSLREREDPNISQKKYSLARRMMATHPVNVIKAYLRSIGEQSDYFSWFDAYRTYLISEEIKNASQDEILLLGKIPYSKFPSDARIIYSVKMDAAAEDFAHDQERISRIIEKKKRERDFERSALVKAIKLEYCRKEITKEISGISFTNNMYFNYMNKIFAEGLPKNNSDLIRLSKDLIPIEFSDDTILQPSSARAGSFYDIFISAFGTNIPAASFEFTKEDINKANPIYKLGNYSGTSFAAPVISGALALVSQACKISPKEAMGRIFGNTEKQRDAWYVFGTGKLDIKSILEGCL